MQFEEKLLLITLISIFSNFSTLNAQNNFPTLFKTTTVQSRSTFKTDQLDTKRVNFLQLNTTSRNNLSELPSKMQFNLFPDVSIEVHLEKSEKSYYKNMEVYHGRSTDRRFAHLRQYRDVIVIYNPNTRKITAQLETDKGAFEISPTKELNTYKISEWENEGINCQDYFYKEELHQQAKHQAQARSGCNEKDADGKYVADLFVGYSYEASVRANDIDAHALSLVEMVNNGLTNSLVDNIYIRLVGTDISEHNPGVVTSVLGNVYNWFAEEIALTGADYVASIQVPTGGPNEAGGWAGVGGYSSVNSINNAAGVFRHELGHNVGSSHCTPGILPYASGFNNGNVKTHMCGNNINFYSTPLVNDDMGVPIGDAATADNGRVWKERAPIVSARRKHTIVFDENDTGCGSAIGNGNYYIQNINSEMYLATANGSTARGTRLVQVVDQAANNQWQFLGIGDGQFRILLTSSTGRAIDLPGSSEDYTIWSLHGGSNQIFSLEEVGTDTFNIIGNKGQCAQVRDASLIAGDTIVHRDCDNSLNTKWRFIPVPNSNVLNLEVAVTDVSCYGEANGSATATATGGTGNYTFSWSTGGTGTSVNNLIPGNYEVTVTDGVTSFPYAFSIKQVAPFEVTLTKTQATSLAGANSSATVVISGGTAPYIYAWSSGATGTTASNLVAGLHNVTITDANGCALVKEFFIDCPDKYKICDDGNSNTFGDHIDSECNCVGKTFICENGLAVANIAIGKIATQSSTSSSAGASRAIDGNRDGNFNNGSVTATNATEGVNAWWQIDLKDETDITGILINNRTDCCTGRLEDYHVFVSTTPFTSDDLGATQNQAGIVYHHYFENATPLPDTLIELSATGRYVRIQSGSDRALNLAEVEIYACGVPTAATITANPLGGSSYELKGYVIPNGSTISGISIEHGSTDLSNIEVIDITGIGATDTFYVNTIVDIGSATNYQFRIKYDTPTKTYYTNEYVFSISTDYCTPTISNYLWYKRYTGIAYGSFVYNNTNAEAYEDLTATLLGEFDMGQSYTLTMRTRTSSWTNLSYIAYIDLNNDNDFDDYNELVGAIAANGNQFNELTITIPTQDVLVATDLRMRIVGHEGGLVNSCTSNVGSFKDITVRIKEGNCTGTGYLVSFYKDMDNDGFGDENEKITRNCSVNTIAGYVKNYGDCDDTKANVNPNAPEICGDGIDNNCDGAIENENIAQGKTTTQSSTGSGGISSRAVDDNTSGVWNDGSITHSSEEENPYWEVDLGNNSSVETITIWNRTDCCGDRLSNFHVFLSPTPFTSDNPDVTAAQSGVWSTFTSNHPTESISFTPNINGRYLRIQINGTGILSLSEVQAFAACTDAMDCTFYADNDGDGYGDPNTSITQADCANVPEGYVSNDQDFNDTERTAYNGAMEICDNIDNDGNGEVDEGADYDSESTTFTNETIPTETYTARTIIETAQSVNVLTNTDVHLIAGQTITLKPGFVVAAGAEFHAQIIEDCTTALNDELAATTRTNTIASSQLTNNELNITVRPNPFRSQTTIDFYLPKASKVILQVYGMNGQLVEEILSAKEFGVGQFSIPFTLQQPKSGFYYFVLKTDTEVRTEKVVVIGN